MEFTGGNSDEESRGDAAATVVDYRGNFPVDKSRTGGWLGAGLILGTELSERMCVMGISMNLVTYLVGSLHLSTSKSANMVTNFMGTLNLLALVAGFLADAKLGRYLTVVTAAAITATGVSLLTVATTLSSMRPPACTDPHDCVAASGRQLALLYASLYTVALGAGGIKANVSGFGSDQFDAGDAEEERSMMFFFNRFYFCISLGSLFAVTALVYVQDNVGRGYGYGVSAAAMVLAVLVLLAGTPRYRFRRPQGSPLTVVWRVAYLAWKKRKVAFPPHESQLNQYESAKAPHTRRLRCLDKAAIITSKGEMVVSMVATVNQVEEVKMILKLLPIWSTCILFWTVYSQMTTFSVEQATYMNRNIRGGGGGSSSSSSSSSSFVLIPSGSLSFFLFLTILLVTSLNEKLLVPVARRFTRNAQGLSSLQRVAVGLALSTAAMVASAAVERRRRGSAARDGTRMSVFWLVPQFLLVGAGEAFAYVGQLEFFIREAPERMKSMSTGLFLAAISMGFFVSSLLVSLVDGATRARGAWIKNNLNDGRLDCFYWMLAALGLVNFLVFLIFASRHEYKVQHSYGSKTDRGLAADGGKEEKTNDAMHVAEDHAYQIS